MVPTHQACIHFEDARPWLSDLGGTDEQLVYPSAS